jgi:hypothetical protein
MIKLHLNLPLSEGYAIPDIEFSALMEAVAVKLLGDPSARTKRELRYGRKGSLKINLEEGTWYSHEEGKGGGVLALIQRETAHSGQKAVKWLRANIDVGSEILNAAAKPQRTGEKIASHEYYDADGVLQFSVDRFDSDTNKCMPRLPNKKKHGISDGDGKRIPPRIPYRLPEMMNAVHDTVFIVEGEKCVEALVEKGFVATTNDGGAKKWHADLNPYFKEKSVIIIPDNDAPGQEHANLVASQLKGIASSVRIAPICSDLAPKADIVDWIAAKGGTETLIDACALVTEAIPISINTGKLIQTSAEFLKDFVPPSYLIDGLLLRRYIYSLTAPTGHGKTVVLLRLAVDVAFGKPFSDFETEPGRVLYFAGENPEDVRTRWLMMSVLMGFDKDTIPVDFIPGTFSIPELRDQIMTESEACGGYALVIIDTSAAYFNARGGGEDENSNNALLDHAKDMRSLCEAPGGPTVVVACHPVKNATKDNLLPRGGGAFLNEVDGNLTLWSDDETITELHWQGKFRGRPFSPTLFKMHLVYSDAVVDQKGRQIPSVIGTPLSEKDAYQIRVDKALDEDRVLALLAKDARLSMADLAMELGWVTGQLKQPHKSKVSRCIERLKKDGLLEKKRNGGLQLTDAGRKENKL